MSAGNLDLRGMVGQFLSEGFTLIRIAEPIPSQVTGTYRAANAFFGTSLVEKLKNRLPHDHGYRPYGVEYSHSRDHPDEVESFTVSRRLPVEDQDIVSVSARLLYRQMISLFDSLEPVAEQFTIALANELAGCGHDDRFRGALRKSSLLQLNYSTPSASRSPYINDEHEDGCLLTIMSVTGPGLEIRTKDSSYIPVCPLDDHLLLIPGEILWLLSGGRIPPCYHRVRVEAECQERMSVLFFADLHPALCMPWVSHDLNRAIDIGSRVLKNSTRYGLSEWDDSEAAR